MNSYNLYKTYVFIQMLLLYKLLESVNVMNILPMTSQIRLQLNKEERNALCCSRGMKCCKKPESPANIEIRAVLVHCPNAACEESVLTRTLNKEVDPFKEKYLKGFQGFDEEVPLIDLQVTNCFKKILITMKISNLGSINNKPEFVVVDHVYDAVSEQKMRLLNPYVIKIKQEPLMENYKLKFVHVVNSEAKEQVHNKDESGYTGCDTTFNNPTCGVVKYRGKAIPFSTGFCCSCDTRKNEKRQPENTKQTESFIRYGDPAFVLNGIECPSNLRGTTREKQAENTKQNQILEEVRKQIRAYGAENFFQKSLPVALPQKAEKLQKPKSIDLSSEDISNFKHNLLQEKETPNNFFLSSSEKEPHTGSKNFFIRNGLKDTSKIVESSDKESGGAHDAEPLNELAQTYFEALKKYSHQKDSGELNDNIKNLQQLPNENVKYGGDSTLQKYINKRQIQQNGFQQRGGQNCADGFTPPGINPSIYHESTHCLKFSPLWYTVYSLECPVIEHSVWIQIFEKHEDEECHTRWRDVTRGKMIQVGTSSLHYKDEASTMSISYKPSVLQAEESEFSINHKLARLLMPEALKKGKTKRSPEVDGGPAEYLVAHTNQVSTEGDKCNVAGVGFEAFFKQPKRCAVPRQSCLANQPKHLWDHDHEAEMQGKKGCFFLKNYGRLPRQPIRGNGSAQYLVMQYSGKHTSTVEFEIRADFNTVLRPQASAQITEVYVDSTSPTKTVLTVKITNTGLVSSPFTVKISDCPLEIPATFSNIQSKPALIPPQRQHIFNLEINFPLPADKFYCSAEALNVNHQLVALRRIRLKKSDRCLCTWHCLCACVESTDGLKCNLMPLDHYHAAGFLGSLPTTTSLVQYTFIDDVFSFISYILLFLLFTLLILGLTKALIGMCCCPIPGMWGLDVLLDLPKQMERYYESSIRDHPVEYGPEGWPVHPESKKRVRNISRSLEFCVNVLFFFTYPVAVLFLLCRRLCCPYYSCDDESEECYCYDGVDDTFGKQLKAHNSSTSNRSSSEHCISFESTTAETKDELETINEVSDSSTSEADDKSSDEYDTETSGSSLKTRMKQWERNRHRK